MPDPDHESRAARPSRQDRGFSRCPGLTSLDGDSRARVDLASAARFRFQSLVVSAGAFVPLHAELTALLASGDALPHLKSRPRIAVVMPVYARRRDLLKAALASLRGQVGVAIDCLISVDGRVEDRQLVEEVVAELEAAGDDSHWRVVER